MSTEAQIDLLKKAVEYYAYNTQDYDFGYHARRTLLMLAPETHGVSHENGREL